MSGELRCFISLTPTCSNTLWPKCFDCGFTSYKNKIQHHCTSSLFSGSQVFPNKTQGWSPQSLGTLCLYKQGAHCRIRAIEKKGKSSWHVVQAGKIPRHKCPSTYSSFAKISCWRVYVLLFILTRIDLKSKLSLLVLIQNLPDKTLKAHILFNLLTDYNSGIIY